MHHATIATAESCTGGLLAERLTRISGSSAYFLGGVVSYSNTLKSAWVDVPAEIIESRGAVSAEVAIALADGIRRRTGATLGVGITGVAGPTGGSPEKPVGTVHVAIADASGSKERGVRYPGERDRIRWQASQTALDLVRRYFLYAAQPKNSAQGLRACVRLFVAMDIPEEVRAAIGALAAKLRIACRNARWVRIEGAHITLKFIGEILSGKDRNDQGSARGHSLPRSHLHKFSWPWIFPERAPPARALGRDRSRTRSWPSLPRRWRRRSSRSASCARSAPFSPHLTLARFDIAARPARLACSHRESWPSLNLAAPRRKNFISIKAF